MRARFSAWVVSIGYVAEIALWLMMVSLFLVSGSCRQAGRSGDPGEACMGFSRLYPRASCRFVVKMEVFGTYFLFHVSALMKYCGIRTFLHILLI